MVDLLGEEPPERGRYAAHSRAGSCEHWTPLDEIALWPILLACKSDAADRAAREWLCDQLDRDSKPAGFERNTKKRVEHKCGLIRMRVVVRHLAGRKKYPLVVPIEELRDALFTGWRTGLPVTWGEYHSVIRPYLDKPKKEEKIDCADVVKYLDRSPDDPFMGSCATGLVDLGSLMHQPGRPTRPDNEPNLRATFTAFRRTDPKDVVQLRERWKALNQTASS